MITVFKLKDGIASFRDSDPDDVIKAKLAFSELDEFEPDPELGINGFMDGQLDTTIRRFQRTRGLLETGEIKAGDDTEKAINAELREVNRAIGRPGSAGSAGSGLQAGMQRRSRPGLIADRLAKDGSGLAPRRQSLAQAFVERGQEPDRLRASQEALPVPAYRREIFRKRPEEWRDWFSAARKLPNISSAELRAYLEIFAAEGGTRPDPTSSASSGILQSTLDRAIDLGLLQGVKKGSLTPRDLSIDQRAAVYRAYFDDVLATIDRSVPGSRVLRRVGDDEAAAAFADTMFRHGRGSGARLIQQAINSVVPGTVTEDGRMGPGTFRAFTELAQSSRQRAALLNALADARNRVTNNAEKARMDHFRFQNSR